MPNDNSSSSDSAIPNLYAVLKLQALENDRQAIETALRRSIAQARQLQSSDPQAAQRIARIVELSKRYLLNEKNKIVYDRKWQAQFGGGQPLRTAIQGDDRTVRSEVPVRSEAPIDGHEAASFEGTTVMVAQSAEDPFAEYLPHGDPTADFDLANFLENSGELPHSSSEDDFRQLMDLLTGTGDLLKSAGESSAHTVIPEPTRYTEPSTVASSVATPAAGTATARPAANGSPRSLAAELRSKRDRKLLTMIAGVLLSLATLLALIFFLMREPLPSSPAVAQNAPAVVEPVAGGNAINGGEPDVPQGSGLPRVSGWDDEPGDGDINDLNQGIGPEGAGQTNVPLNMGLTQGERPSADEPPMDSMPTEPMPDIANKELMPDKGPMNATEPMAANPSAAATPAAPVVELTDEERRVWFDKMRGIREQLSQKDFTEAKPGLEELTALIKTPSQRQQALRLKTLAGLAEEFQRALVEAVASLEGGDVITVGSTPASFVEGSPERLVVKVSGQQNRSFSLIDMPTGLALTLSEYRLEIGSPQTAARQAAFAGLHPRLSDVALQRARELMQQAIDGGAVADDMLLVFEEDYLASE